MSPTDLKLHFFPMVRPPTKKFLREFQKDAGWFQPSMKIDNSPKDKRWLQWVSVELDDMKIGIARLELSRPECCYISDFVIKRKYRGQGVGRWFLIAIEIYCARLGIRRLLLVPEAGSHPFYEALYFVPDPFVPGILKKDISPFKMFFIRGKKYL
jgi:GNAT superfamily N-acetyltransferase